MACVSWRPEGDHTSQLPLQPGQATPAVVCSSSQSSRPQGWQSALTHSARTQRERDCHSGWRLGPKPAYPHLSQKGPMYHPLRREIMLAMPLPPGEGNSRSWQRRPRDPPAFEASLSATSGPQATSAPLSETTSSPTRPSTTLCLTFGHTVQCWDYLISQAEREHPKGRTEPAPHLSSPTSSPQCLVKKTLVLFNERANPCQTTNGPLPPW